jgi:hyperosmotically inducible periplasmic protein
VRTSGSSRITGAIAAVALAICAAYANAQTTGDVTNAATAPAQPITTSSIHRRSDAELVRDVRLSLSRTSGVNVSGIHVRSRNAAVTLTGHVPQRAQVARASSAARSVRGVRSVSNRLTVRTRGGNVH